MTDELTINKQTNKKKCSSDTKQGTNHFLLQLIDETKIKGCQIPSLNDSKFNQQTPHGLEPSLPNQKKSSAT